MTVLVSLRCLDCGDVHDDEVETVFVLARKGERVDVWYHDLTKADLFNMLSIFFESLSEEYKKEGQQ